jgi:uncharacterized protein
MKVVIPGGTGQIGVLLAKALLADRHEVVVLSRAPRRAPWRVVQWDAESQGAWTSEFEGADVVIHLAGRSVNCRYTDKNRKQILDSRVKSTLAVGRAIAKAVQPPKLWLQSSTATIYAHRYDAPNDEKTGILGGNEENAPDTWRFSIEVAKVWESAAMTESLPNTRRVLLRAAMTMSPDRKGVFDVLLGLARKGLGGTNGDGKQFVSWIHDFDFVRSIYWLIEHTELEGPINLASPNPLPNAEFMRTLRKAWGVKLGLPATKWMIEIGTFLMRTESELVLKSRRVVPGRLLSSGFRFEFPSWEDAVADLCQRYRRVMHIDDSLLE